MELLSVSKGTFAFAEKPIYHKQKGRKNLKKNHAVDENTNSHLRDESQPWYKAFQENWSAIEGVLNEVDTSVYKKLLSDLMEFIHEIQDDPAAAGEIPTGIVMTGVNLLDRDILFDKIKSQLEMVTPYTSIIWSRDATNLRSLSQKLIAQIINTPKFNDSSELSNIQCTFHALFDWCKINNGDKTPVVIILPDFECFPKKMVHDLILILGLYAKDIKFVLITGVATTLHTVHQSLSYSAMSKLKIKVFRSKRPIQILSEVLELVLLNPSIQFKLVGKSLKVLVDMFLLYDFSINGFFQSYKLCLWTHFYNKNERSLCCEPGELGNRVSALTSKDTNHLRDELCYESLQDYLGSENDDELKELVFKCSSQFHTYMDNFLKVLQCLRRLTINLPGPPFGRTFREIYVEAVNESNIFETTQYKQAIALISCLSREDLLNSTEALISIWKGGGKVASKILKKLRQHMTSIKIASTDNFESFEDDAITPEQCRDRSSWNKSLQMRTVKLSRSPYKEAVIAFVEYLDERVFRKYLKSPKNIPLNEVFCYWEMSTVLENIKGPLHQDVFRALNRPYLDLDCECCDSTDDAILSTYPDITILYKLHLESRKMINLYDLLQSYLCIVAPERSDNQDLDPELYARFSRAVAELQMLGFIKNTRRKVDHVKRLT
ncbi:hypothetical protein QAD02_007018 [Eretmocerus hayati]|uniref:Uncharacterized protein n=1 Tax=Eretmocerus hayati TaxID=131215 RepID=A0ACC2N388_9HYME|nr:hypothetical protein QAD02_007018 [Eretmocerus hayati]